jgi:hypothetical protein
VKISWEKGRRTAVDAALGVHVLTVTGHGSALEDQPHSLHPKPVFETGALAKLQHFSAASAPTWKAALLASARKTSLGNEFAADAPLGANPVTFDNSPDGTFIVFVGENQYRASFTVHCVGHTAVSGTVTGTLTGGTASFAIQCGVPLPADLSGNANSKVALKYCPKG